MRIDLEFCAFLTLCSAGLVLAGCSHQESLDAKAAEASRVIPAAGAAMPTSEVYFSLGSAKLTTEGQNTIRAAAEAANKGDSSTVHAAGYADTLGSARSNEELSRRRAQAVAAQLVEYGLPQERIAVDWYGEQELPEPTADGTANPSNRVVTIKS